MTPQQSMITDKGDIILQRTGKVYSFRPFRIMVKLPEEIYQIYFEMAQTEPDRDLVKRRIFTDLIGWVADKYPDYGMIAFEDYNRDSADEVSRITGWNITWGMYLVLELGARTSIGSTPATEHLIQSSQKLLDNG